MMWNPRFRRNVKDDDIVNDLILRRINPVVVNRGRIVARGWGGRKRFTVRFFCSLSIEGK